MDIVSIHPHERAGQSSEFGRVAAAIDEAEAVAWDRIGGATLGDVDAVRSLERRLANLRPVELHDMQWLVWRLARAVENGWQRSDAMALARLAV